MGLVNMDLESFLDRNRISQANWESANINWDELKKIGLDHQEKMPDLDKTAEFLAKTLQKCNQVHSVRWRVKDPEHLMEKIVRKRINCSEKYNSISVSNYTETVTDLIGVRVLHLFKYEWENIHCYIFENWGTIENTVAYIRTGDEGAIVDSYKSRDCIVKDHPAGYRSIHYVITTQPTKKTIFSEIQVRTIFEEGWSEIDHKIRYPNFSNNELISYFLTIFNRMAGSADEMGTFVKNLSAAISLQDIKELEIHRLQEEHLSKIQVLVEELSHEKKQSKTKDNKLEELNKEIKKLRKNSYDYSSCSIIPDMLNTSLSAKVLAANSGLLSSDAINKAINANVGMLSAERIAKALDANSGILSSDAINRAINANVGMLSAERIAKAFDANSGILSSDAINKAVNANVGMLSAERIAKVFDVSSGILSSDTINANAKKKGIVNKTNDEKTPGEAE